MNTPFLAFKIGPSQKSYLKSVFTNSRVASAEVLDSCCSPKTKEFRVFQKRVAIEWSLPMASLLINKIFAPFVLCCPMLLSPLQRRAQPQSKETLPWSQSHPSSRSPCRPPFFFDASDEAGRFRRTPKRSLSTDIFREGHEMIGKELVVWGLESKKTWLLITC